MFVISTDMDLGKVKILTNLNFEEQSHVDYSSKNIKQALDMSPGMGVDQG